MGSNLQGEYPTYLVFEWLKVLCYSFFARLPLQYLRVQLFHLSIFTHTDDACFYVRPSDILQLI